MSRDNRNWGLELEGRMRGAITPHRLGQIENGSAVATLDVWVRLAGTLGVSLDELLAGVRWVPVPPEEKRGEGAYLVKRKPS